MTSECKSPCTSVYGYTLLISIIDAPNYKVDNGLPGHTSIHTNTQYHTICGIYMAKLCAAP